MLWCPTITVYTEHKNLMQEALVLTNGKFTTVDYTMRNTATSLSIPKGFTTLLQMPSLDWTMGLSQMTGAQDHSYNRTYNHEN